MLSTVQTYFQIGNMYILEIIRHITFNIITVSIFDIKYVSLMKDSIILAKYKFYDAKNT